MKRFFNFFFILISFLYSSCNKGDLIEATVVHDCTGSYLRIGELDYAVCNTSSVKLYKDGEVIRVSFNKLSTCTQDGFFCMMLHANEGFVKVTHATKK